MNAWINTAANLDACKCILAAATTMRFRPIYLASCIASLVGYEQVPALVALRRACLAKFTGRKASAERAALAAAVEGLAAHIAGQVAA